MEACQSVNEHRNNGFTTYQKKLVNSPPISTYHLGNNGSMVLCHQGTYAILDQTGTETTYKLNWFKETWCHEYMTHLTIQEY